MPAVLKKLDWVAVGAVTLLNGIGLMALSILSPLAEGNVFGRQVIFLGIAYVLWLMVSRFNVELLRTHPLPVVILYVLTVAALAGVFVFGARIRGATSWFRLGSLSFQPSEFAKITLIALLAKYFTYRHVELYRSWHIVVSGLYTAVVALLILRQPDFGTALIIFATWLGMVIVAGLPLRRLLFVAAGVAGLAVLAWLLVLAPYQKERVISYLHPTRDPLGASYSQLQSQIAIGSAGLFGKGFSGALQAKLGFVTEPHTDFIFATIVEIFGAVGGVIVLGLFAVLLWRLLSFAFVRREDQLVPPSNFGRLFAAGFAVLIFTEVTLNVGMNIGLVPVTGIPLPFVSYGGSHTLAFLLGFGMYQALYVRTR